jgi:cystathionine gamma-synthase
MKTLQFETLKHENNIIQDLKDRETLLYVEERFGRNLPLELVQQAKVTLQKRISGVLGDVKGQQISNGTNRYCKGLGPEHVTLFPCGMSAIYFSLKIVYSLKPGLKTVQYGYLLY